MNQSSSNHLSQISQSKIQSEPASYFLQNDSSPQDESINSISKTPSQDIYKDRKRKKKKKGKKRIIIKKKVVQKKVKQESNSKSNSNSNSKLFAQKNILNYFILPIKQEAKQIKPIQTSLKLQLTKLEAEFLNKILFQSANKYCGYSFQKFDSNHENIIKSKISQNQLTLERYCGQDKFFKSKQGLENSKSLIQEQRTHTRKYSQSYSIIKKSLQQMKQSPHINQFFKTHVQQLYPSSNKPFSQYPENYCGNHEFKKYYQDYNNVIQNPLDLRQIEEMIQNKDIQNFHQFQICLQQMIQNSQIIHTYLDDEYMLKESEKAQRAILKIIINNVKSQINDFQKLSIKTTLERDNKKIKSKRILVETSNPSQNRQKQFLDLDDQMNKHRLQVMNQFLQKLCLSNQNNISLFHRRINQLAYRDSASSIQIKTKMLQRSKSLTLIADKISLDLFQGIKGFIKSELRENKKVINRGLTQQQILRNRLYPHLDSSDFDQDSYDS